MFSFLLGLSLGMELQGLMATMFNCWKQRWTVFLSGYTILQSYCQRVRVSISPHPDNIYLFVFFSLVCVIHSCLFA